MEQRVSYLKIGRTNKAPFVICSQMPFIYRSYSLESIYNYQKKKDKIKTEIIQATHICLPRSHLL